MNPITVNQDNTLIAGLHRLEAVKLLGWTKIKCTISDVGGLQADLAEIDENFVRVGLSHRELGDLLLRRKKLYEAIHPETRQGQRNGQTAKNANLSLLETKSFSQDTAYKLGVSKRTVQSITYSLICKWFRAAVLPLDAGLCTALLYRDRMKPCAICGGYFLPNSNRAK